MEDNLSFDEFRTRLLKRHSKKNFKIKGSLGSKYIHRSVDKKHPLKLVSECDFLHIVRTINNYLAEDIVNGEAISLPHLGTFYVYRKELKTFIKDNKIKTQKQIDWYSTHKLWYEDPEAYKEGIVLRFDTSDTYIVGWFKQDFNNKTLFKFTPVRALRLKIKEQVKKDKDIYIYGE